MTPFRAADDDLTAMACDTLAGGEGVRLRSRSFGITRDDRQWLEASITLADGRQLLSVDSEGVLSLNNPATGRVETIATDFPAFSPLVSIIISLMAAAMLNGAFSRQTVRQTLVASAVAVLLAYLPKIMLLKPFAFLQNTEPEYVAVAILLPAAIAAIAYGVKKHFRHTKFVALCFISAIIFIFSVNFIFDNILQPHQRARIENLLGIEEDLMGAGYNVHQSKIAIGSGGFWGKGFLNGTQTKFDFVPEQSTDFIFCTIGEEHGFVGSVAVILLYGFMIVRIILLSERQRNTFVRIYGYCVACCFFMHFFINIGMTIGLVPVIGIPLPFLSYGGSSLWSFTAMLFIFIRLDLERWK